MTLPISLSDMGYGIVEAWLEREFERLITTADGTEAELKADAIDHIVRYAQRGMRRYGGGTNEFYGLRQYLEMHATRLGWYENLSECEAVLQEMLPYLPEAKRQEACDRTGLTNPSETTTDQFDNAEGHDRHNRAIFNAHPNVGGD